MNKPQEPSDYRILGYSDKDKQELNDREIAAKVVSMDDFRRKKFVSFIVKNSKSF